MNKTEIRPADIIIFLLLIFIGIFITVRPKSHSSDTILINANGQTYQYSTQKDAIYTVQGCLGPTVIEIKNKRVHIIDSCCPNKTCINQGYKSPLVCLPNKVIISYGNDGEFDAFSE